MTAPSPFPGPERPRRSAPPAATLDGQPWQTEVTWSYRADEAGAWRQGLPQAPGRYQLRAEVAEAAGHTAASAQTVLDLFCFRLADGAVTGSVPMELPGGQGDCRIIAALYDRDSGRLLDAKAELHRLDEGTVVLRDLRLDPKGGTDLLVKVFVLGQDLDGLLPAPQLHPVS